MYVHQTVMINHFVGLPIVQLYVMVKNTGGKALHVVSIGVDVLKNGRSVFSTEAQSYFDSPAAKDSVLLVPFDLEPERRWGHLVNFGTVLDRQEQRRFDEEKRGLRADISAKLEQRNRENPEGEGQAGVVVASEDVVAPLLARFNRYFIWNAGDYTLTLRVLAENGLKAEQTYRFTIFEGDQAELAAHSDGYKTGEGLFYGIPTSAILPTLETKY